VGGAALGLGALAVLGSAWCDSAVAAAGLIALALMSVSAHLPAWWAVVTEISGKHLGALFGLMNSLGVPGAVASQLFFGRFADYREGLGFSGRAQWDPGFYVYAVVLCVGAVAWLLVDETRSAVEPPRQLTLGAKGSPLP
jgi:hypothetical protein